jgi:hypothetical protein
MSNNETLSSQTPSKEDTKKEKKDSSGDDKKPRLVWTEQTEDLLVQWGDLSACYKWLHDQSYRKYKYINYFYSFPVIVLSTLTGTLNVGLSGYVPEKYVTYAQAGIGAINIFTGILTTLQSYYGYAQLSESHNNACLGWSKMHRNITIELNLEKEYRTDADRFLRDCRRDYDRLIEQSPPIPSDIIQKFNIKFKNNKHIIRPDICDNITHTEVYRVVEIIDKFEEPEEHIKVVSLNELKDILVDESINNKRRNSMVNNHLHPLIHNNIYREKRSHTDYPKSTNSFNPRIQSSSNSIDTHKQNIQNIKDQSIGDIPIDRPKVKDLIKKYTTVENIISSQISKSSDSEEKIEELKFEIVHDDIDSIEKENKSVNNDIDIKNVDNETTSVNNDNKSEIELSNVLENDKKDEQKFKTPMKIPINGYSYINKFMMLPRKIKNKNLEKDEN